MQTYDVAMKDILYGQHKHGSWSQLTDQKFDAPSFLDEVLKSFSQIQNSNLYDYASDLIPMDYVTSKFSATENYGEWLPHSFPGKDFEKENFINKIKTNIFSLFVDFDILFFDFVFRHWHIQR